MAITAFEGARRASSPPEGRLDVLGDGGPGLALGLVTAVLWIPPMLIRG